MRDHAVHKGVSPRVWSHAGSVSAVQLLWKYPLADERYVSESAWEHAILDVCPFHPDGGCGVEKLGSYPRVEPVGVRIPRWWCPKQRASVSLLPSFLAARLSGTLAAVQDIVAAVERAGSIAAAVDVVHPPDARAPGPRPPLPLPPRPRSPCCKNVVDSIT